MAEWTSIHDILHDLSVAQGCTVPAALETVGNSQPPAMVIDEEIEENPLYQCDGGGDFAAPDYNLIQKMLNMVTEKNDNEKDGPADDSDLNPFSLEFVPNAVKKKIKRNAAIESIITNKEAKLAARRPVSKDVVPVMFKRKSINKVNSTTVSPTEGSSPVKCNEYTPSILANEYYSKYLKKSQLRAQFEEDIWSRTERQMKEMDAKKKPEAGLMSPQAFGFKIIELPQHRHLLIGKCVVCQVTSKHGYEFKELP